jgi:hypothetical protein
LNRVEMKQFRQRIAGTFDRHPAVAVQYTLEEGNNWILRVVVVRTTDLRVVGDVIVGGKGWRSVNLEAVDGCLAFRTMNYGASDSLGSPSLKGETHYCMGDGGDLEEGETRIFCRDCSGRR